MIKRPRQPVRAKGEVAVELNPYGLVRQEIIEDFIKTIVSGESANSLLRTIKRLSNPYGYVFPQEVLETVKDIPLNENERKAVLAGLKAVSQTASEKLEYRFLHPSQIAELFSFLAYSPFERIFLVSLDARGRSLRIWDLTGKSSRNYSSISLPEEDESTPEENESAKDATGNGIIKDIVEILIQSIAFRQMVGEFMKRLAETNCHYIVLVHNHPTDSKAELGPSKPDLDLFRFLAEKANEYGIYFRDAIIVGSPLKMTPDREVRHQFFSLARDFPGSIQELNARIGNRKTALQEDILFNFKIPSTNKPNSFF